MSHDLDSVLTPWELKELVGSLAETKVSWGPSVRYGGVYGGVHDPSKIRAMYGGWDLSGA
eukprot:1143956-Pelagomonas_calceolata.AAC.1